LTKKTLFNFESIGFLKSKIKEKTEPWLHRERQIWLKNQKLKTTQISTLKTRFSIQKKQFLTRTVFSFAHFQVDLKDY
jgi:hypothetical protein